MDSIATFEKNFANFSLTPNTKAVITRRISALPVLDLLASWWRTCGLLTLHAQLMR